MGKFSFDSAGIDNIDRRIMFQLDLDSRQSTSGIAKKLSLNKGVVNYRISKLIEENFILGFYALIDTPRTGLEGFRIYLKYENIDETTENEIINFFTKSKLSWWVGSIDGEWDIGIVIWTKNVYGLKELWKEFSAKFGEFVQRKSVFAYTSLYGFPCAFLSPEKILEIPMYEIGGNETIEISEQEKKVLELISRNARMPTVEIAKKTGLSPIQVKYAIKKLLKNRIIKGFKAIFNLEKLQLSYYKIDIELKDVSKYQQLLNFARQEPNIIYVNETIGGADFEIEALVQNHSQVHEIMQEMRRKFPKTIKNYTYYIYSKIHKIRYF